MTGLDVTAEWVLLDPDPIPVPEPQNDDDTLRPPTERDAPVNPKYKYKETFEHHPFLGTTEDMTYMASYRSPMKKKGQKKRKLSPTKQNSTNHAERVMGGPSAAFLKKHGLDEYSHPMDWWTSLMPLTPADNKEDTYEVNVKGDRVSKFSVAN
jgi:hypothetical protein